MAAFLDRQALLTLLFQKMEAQRGYVTWSHSQEEAVSEVKPSVLTPDQERQGGLHPVRCGPGMQALWARGDASIARPCCDCPGLSTANLCKNGKTFEV